ncbi:hypothetical protein R1flu_008735 [Riccia fluitans]|uniref:Uncharacterized protein n=1 Tax=Riccia fluitans TaxID=41844 RepID=A0ABD1YCS9_9MARC
MNEVDKEQRGTKRKAQVKKPKSRPKLWKAKTPVEIVDLSKETKKEAELVLAEDTSEAEVEDIESFRLAMLFGSQTFTNILQILVESRMKVERVIERRMSLLAIAEHLSKENPMEELNKLREEVQRATVNQAQTEDEIKALKL